MKALSARWTAVASGRGAWLWALLVVAALVTTTFVPMRSVASQTHLGLAEDECGFLGSPEGPATAAFDPARGEVFVADSETNFVYVISAISNKIVASISMGFSCVNPFGVAYDPTLGGVLVSEIGGHSITEISDLTNNVTASVPVLGGGPLFIAYDQGQNEVFATDLDQNVSVVSLTTQSPVTVISSVQALGPLGITYDSNDGEIFTADGSTNSNGLSAIYDTTNTAAFIPISCATPPPADDFELPFDVVYDSLNGNLYTACELSGSLSVVSAENHTQFETIQLPGASSGGPLAINPSTRTIWVADWNEDELYAVSDLTGEVVAQGSTHGFPGWGIAVDPGTGDVYVPQFKNESIGVFGPDAQLIAEIAVPMPSTPAGPPPPPTLEITIGVLGFALAVLVILIIVNRRRSSPAYGPLGEPLASDSPVAPTGSGSVPPSGRGPG